MKLTKKPTLITKDDILNVVSPYDIYRFYFGEFKLNRKYLNHLRGDKNQPSFEIFTKFGNIYHVDYGSDYWRGDCFSLVMQIYGCNLNAAINIIASDFRIGEPKEVRKSVITWTKPTIEEVAEKPTIIQATVKKFTSESLKYWADYELGEDDIRGEVFLIKSLYINRVKIYSSDDLVNGSEIVYGYRFGDYWKILRPFAEDRNNKWRTNCPIDVMYGLENISNCETSFIVKSKKDQLVVRKFISPCTAGVQNESSVAISDENIDYILNNSKRAIIIFDNDATGVESCTFYNRKGFDYFNIPKKYYIRHKIKDPSDFVKFYGSARLIREIQNKIK